MVTAYRNKAIDSGFGSLFGKAVEKTLGEGLPDDTADLAKDYLKALAQVYLPGALAKGEQAAAKLDPMIGKGVKALAPIGLNAGKLLLAGRAMGADPDKAGLRLVNPALTFEEARRYYQWNGTLVDARIGTILSGPADPTKYFTLYVPDKRIMIRSSFEITIRDRQYA
jgi:hypothetical protein